MPLSPGAEDISYGPAKPLVCPAETCGVRTIQVDEGAAVREVLAVAAELRQFEDRGAW